MSIASVLRLKRHPEQREGARARIRLAATLLVAGRPLPVHLLDLSRRGALAHGEESPAEGEMVWLVCQGTEILARTAWVRGPRFGLAFQATLPLPRYEALRDEGRRRLAEG